MLTSKLTLDDPIKPMDFFNNIQYSIDDIIAGHNPDSIRLFIIAIYKLYKKAAHEYGINFKSDDCYFSPDTFTLTYGTQDIDEYSLFDSVFCGVKDEYSYGEAFIAPFYSLKTYNVIDVELSSIWLNDIFNNFFDCHENYNLEDIFVGKIFKEFSRYIQALSLISDREDFEKSIKKYILEHTSFAKNTVDEIICSIFSQKFNIHLPIETVDVINILRKKDKSSRLKQKSLNDCIHMLFDYELNIDDIPYFFKNFTNGNWIQTDDDESYLQLRLFIFRSKVWYKFKHASCDFRHKYAELCNSLDSCLNAIEEGISANGAKTWLDGVYINECKETLDICFAVGYDFCFDASFGYEKIRASFAVAAMAAEPLLNQFNKLYNEYSKKDKHISG